MANNVDLKETRKFYLHTYYSRPTRGNFLADEVLVLSGRPASLQFQLDVKLGDDRKLDDLYTNETTKSLAILRKQIEIAQKSMI